MFQIPTPAEAGGEHGAAIAEAATGRDQLPPQLGDVRRAPVGQIEAFEQIPDAFIQKMLYPPGRCSPKTTRKALAT